MAQLGADVDLLDGLSRRFTQAAGDVQTMISQISTQITEAWWQGTDADNFRTQWDGTFKTQLQNIITALQDTGTQVKSQADQQRQASA